MIYTGKQANNIFQKVLVNRKIEKCCGYFFEKNAWVAFDNSTEDCWVEEFKSEELAICWLENFFEVSEPTEFDVLKLNDKLLFIPFSGYLQINFIDEKVITKFFSV